ncbi:MAG: patatin-like phospholipase family protein, partial [Pseudonocardiaceae bacterium]
MSLAVWMGGACSEIDRFRRTRPGDSTPYGRLLEAAGYSSAVVDVIAGTSAGGLNGALMAASVVDGRVFDEQVRNLWLRIGDLGKLLRPVFGRWPKSLLIVGKSLLIVGKSLLDGDGYFYDQLYKEMKNLRQEFPAGQKPGQVRLDLVLTGTLLDPQKVTDYPALGASIHSTRHRAAFRFRHQQRRPENEIPPPKEFNYRPSDFLVSGKVSEQCLQQLAYAARSTSSFPGAFEPARIRFVRSTASDREPPEPPSTFYGIYSESRTSEPTNKDDDADRVVDGGVLDNIPISWAVRSIAAAPASGAVDRWRFQLSRRVMSVFSDPRGGDGELVVGASYIERRCGQCGSPSLSSSQGGLGEPPCEG